MKPTYEELEKQLEIAKKALQAIRSGKFCTPNCTAYITATGALYKIEAE